MPIFSVTSGATRPARSSRSRADRGDLHAGAGSRVFSVTVRDGRGGVATDTVTVTRVLTKEIVLWAADFVDDIQGRWTLVRRSDGGRRRACIRSESAAHRR